MGVVGEAIKKRGIPEDIAEGIDIALDLPFISLGLSRTIAKQIAGKSAGVLAKPLTESVPKGIKSFLEKDISTKTVGKVSDVLNKLRPSNLIGKTKNYLTRSNTADNVETSIERLTNTTELSNKSGEKLFVTNETPELVKVEIKKSGYTQESKYNPLRAYDDFYEQEVRFKKDIKQDTAISKVGEQIGDSYDRVIKQRTETGKRMGEELKKIGNIRTDIAASFENFEKELADNGLAYDIDSKSLKRTRTSKVTSEDRDLIQDYVEELNKLGSELTVAELDAFLSRIPKELDVFKRAKNITSVTNGERIIKSHLRELREVFNPKKDKRFTNYYAFRKDYAALSDFLDEGARFLGGKSQSGDYVKDASIAKSAVQSILNQGKKDWLLKLEELTGYPVLDESVLALQAMKDAGNFRGRSLLELLTEQQGVPTSAGGLTQKALQSGVDFLGRRFVGSSRDQTRRVIMEIMQGGEKIPSQL